MTRFVFSDGVEALYLIHIHGEPIREGLSLQRQGYERCHKVINSRCWLLWWFAQSQSPARFSSMHSLYSRH
jgi:hypothetical protein